MKKKSILLMFTLIAAVCLAFAFAACSGGSSENEEEGDDQTSQTTPQEEGEDIKFANYGDYCEVWGLNSDIGDVVIPAEHDGLPVTSIATNAFYNCTSVISVTIPSTVTSVGAFAFSGCENLAALYIEDVASWCEVSFPNSTANPLSFAGNLYVGGELVSSLVIPEGVVSIAPYTFYGCTSITSVTVPSTVTAMGSEAFSYCSSLEGVYAASISSWCAVDFDGSSSNPLREAGNLYTGGALVTSLDGLEGAEKIGAYALYGCTSLTSAKVPSSVLSLGEYSFCGCSSLVFVSVPGSVEEVKTFSFSDCTALESVVLGEGVKALRRCSFSGCMSLESVVIPASMEAVGEKAFYGCGALSAVYYGGASSSEWSGITVTGSFNTELSYATRYYYSAEKPSGEGNFWHYTEDGEIVVWTDDDE